MSNGVSREESGTSGTADETIQAILDKVRVQGIAQEERAKAQRSNTGGKPSEGPINIVHLLLYCSFIVCP